MPEVSLDCKNEVNIVFDGFLRGYWIIEGGVGKMKVKYALARGREYSNIFKIKLVFEFKFFG